MRKAILLLVLGLALAAFAVAGCGGDDDEGAATDAETITDTTDTDGAAAGGGTLIGSVGPGFEISLTMEDGAGISTLAPGSYTIEVDDQADIHNFHLTGPGVDESTDVAETGSETFEVDLQPGMYTYLCDPHAVTMVGTFEVAG